jgi:SAM-dependent methyltransferase
MHEANLRWLEDAQERFGAAWVEGAILEIGALNINGSARSRLRSVEYVGVDCTAGPCVDIVCRSTETLFEDRAAFDCLILTQVLEHDPTWRESILHNAQWLRQGGVLLLSWGAEGNPRHDPEPWAPVPVGDVLAAIVPTFAIAEACWEGRRYRGEVIGGCYDIIATKR